MASTTPIWNFASTIDGERSVIINDADHDYSCWAVEIEHNDELHIGQLAQRTVWRSNERDLNLLGLGDSVTGWAAGIEPGATPLAFVTPTGARLQVDPWAHTAEWLVESLFGQPVALIIDLGPSEYIPSEHEEDDEVVCAQIQVMADGVFMLRRSRSELGHLLLADYSTAGITLDKWHNNDQFDDCTDGYIFSRDVRLIADTCVTWFRDNWGAQSTDELGCEYRFPDELSPDDPTLF